MRSRFFAAAATLALALVAFPAHAEPTEDDRRAARNLAADAKVAFDGSNWTTSLDLYRRAGQLMPAPTLWVREARCLVKLQRLVEAREVYVKSVRAPLPSPAPRAYEQAVREAEAELAALDVEIPRLRITVAAQRFEVVLDGVVLPAAVLGTRHSVDPGAHTISGSRDGAAVKPYAFTVGTGQSQDVSFDSLPASDTSAVVAVHVPVAATAPLPAAPPSSGPSPFAWVALGVGVAGLGTGITTGLVAGSQHSALEAQCPAGACSAAAEADLEGFRTMRMVSTVGYVVAAVGLATGAVLYFTTKSSSKSTQPSVGFGVGGVAGSF